jgi:type II secretory ATPase GspE/PulE/Tfp pilus assembly ATPase PilB-like protein
MRNLFSGVIEKISGQKRVHEKRGHNAIGEASIVPEHIIVFSKPDDLPHNDGQIQTTSNRNRTDSRQSIHLSPSLLDKVIILKTSQYEAAAVVSTELYNQQITRSLYASIREQLSARKIDLKSTHWGTPSLVNEIAKSKESSIKRNQVEVNIDSENERRFREIVEHSFKIGATDFHIESKKKNALVRLRIDSELYPIENGAGGQILSDAAQSMISYVFTWLLNAGSNSAGHYNPALYRNCTVSMNLNVGGGVAIKLRVQSNPTIDGPDMIVRILKDEESRTFAESGYSPDQVKMLTQKISVRAGNIYFAGIPNSGKTTSTRACLESMPGRQKLKIVMIADPIEYELPFVSNATIQRSLSKGDGAGDGSYLEALNSWLRGNPDVLDMGEIRDYDSGVASITVGETGCLALGTVHAHSAIGIFQRLTSPAIGIDIHTLTAPKMVSLLVYQSLVPKLCTACRIPYSDVEIGIKQRMQVVAEKFNVDMSKTYYRAHKIECPICSGRGTKGVTLVAELISPSAEFLKHIRDGNYFEALDSWTKTSDGRWDTEDMTGKEVFAHAFYKAQQGIIDPHVVEEKFGNYDLISPFFKHRATKLRDVKMEEVA